MSATTRQSASIDLVGEVVPGEPGLVGEGEGQEGVELGLEGVGL